MTKSTSKTVRCRFAPSPTGSLHVGGARTALFNYLFAAHNEGTFVLRVEDTDLQRSTPEAVETILNGLNWLGITADEGPFFQSKRFSLYQDAAKKLLESGYAYPCSCTAEELAKIREAQKSEGKTPHYSGIHRPAEQTPQSTRLPSADDSEPFVIRLRTPRQGFKSFSDLIVGDVNTPLEEIDDFIIVRSDGTPTYNFVVVVDDADMAISHVIRGMDHISNTPKQLLIYEALDATAPTFAHIPMILGPDKKKLSKRHGATSVFEYKKDGYLSDGFVNYIARLGWSYGDQEVFTREELKACFGLENVGKSAGVFDTTKLVWVNAEHIKLLSPAELAPFVVEYLENDGFPVSGLCEDSCFLNLIEQLKERSKTLVEMAAGCHWYLHTHETLTIDEKAGKKHLKAAAKAPLSMLLDKLQEVDSFDEASLEPIFHKVVEELEIKLGKLAQPLRVAVTGSSASPPIYDVLEILGKEETLKRLEKGIAQIPEA